MSEKKEKEKKPPKLECPECSNKDRCQMRPDREKYFEKLDPCRFFNR
jgi:hypothetical protein